MRQQQDVTEIVGYFRGKEAQARQLCDDTGVDGGYRQIYRSLQAGYRKAADALERLSAERSAIANDVRAAVIEGLPSAETMLAYASILEKPKYQVDEKTGIKYRLATGEVVEAACAALRACAALTQPAPDAGQPSGQRQEGE
jgi:hypothetical protein